MGSKAFITGRRSTFWISKTESEKNLSVHLLRSAKVTPARTDSISGKKISGLEIKIENDGEKWNRFFLI